MQDDNSIPEHVLDAMIEDADPADMVGANTRCQGIAGYAEALNKAVDEQEAADLRHRLQRERLGRGLPCR